MSELAPGTIVVCVSSFEHWRRNADRLGVALPHVGVVYTVRDVVEVGNTVGLRLEEILNPVSPRNGVEFCYDQTAFRPVRRPDISALRVVLTSDAERVSA
ncbi:hypothetical protein V5F77_02650 [Xanthobacter sp. DSM 24535]|uniref:hypothetical protein n=1 Tax=Roseixanthobacter psychrophilus TaxID=3119917 RepID=UPI003728B119